MKWSAWWAAVAVTWMAATITAKHPDSYRNTQEMVMARGYYCENYTVVTEDGYVLLTFRIPGKKGQKKGNGQPVLINHGFIMSSDNMLDNGDDAFPYMLADQGYDVWILNNRGNRYSRKHVTLDPDSDSSFFEFSLHEQGVFDLKANVELILNKTSYTKIVLLGYSQGGADILAALSEDSEYYKKYVKSVVLWAPVSNMEHSNNLLTLLYCTFSIYALEFFGLREFFPWERLMTSFTSTFCKLNPAICNLVLAIIADSNPFYDNQERWEVLLSHYPAGSSMISLLHLVELKIHKGFIKHRKTVFHKLEHYNLSRIDKSFPTAVFVGKQDNLVSYKDGEWLARVLTNTGALKLFRKYECMGHLTFVLPSWRAQTFMEDTLKFIKTY